MKVGIGLPSYIPWAKNTDVLEWARRADAGTFSSLASIDRLVYRGSDPLIALAAAAAVTRRIRLMTTVLLAPLHEPALLAKQAASLDALSGGRLTLGLGVGAREDDFAAAGTAYKGRGKRFERQVETMKRIWAGEAYSDRAGAIGPQPVQAGGPELLFGGYTPAAVQRAGRLADGFITGGMGNPAAARQMFAAFEQAWKAAGRQGQPRLISAVYTAVGEDPAGRGGEYLRDYYGERGAQMAQGMIATPQALHDALRGFEDAGANELVLWTTVPDLDQLDRLQEIVVKTVSG